VADHRSSETRIPDWAVIPFWAGVLCLIAAWVFAGVAVGVHYLAG
jgi:hypothetical protein